MIDRCRLAERKIAIPFRNTAAAHGQAERRKTVVCREPKSASQKFSEVAADVANGLRIGSIVTTGWSTSVECGAVANAYLRAAQAYMLISMPTGTSMIFGVFQVISDLLSSRRQVADRNNDRTDPKIAQADILLAQFRELGSSGHDEICAAKCQTRSAIRRGLVRSAPVGKSSPTQYGRAKNPDRHDNNRRALTDGTLSSLARPGAILGHDLVRDQRQDQPDAKWHDDQIVDVTEHGNEIRNEVDR
jgi:hypothetical protein